MATEDAPVNLERLQSIARSDIERGYQHNTSIPPVDALRLIAVARAAEAYLAEWDQPPGATDALYRQTLRERMRVALAALESA